MSPDHLKKALAQRKTQAEQEKLGHLERLGMAEGYAMACQTLLDLLDQPDPVEPTP